MPVGIYTHSQHCWRPVSPSKSSTNWRVSLRVIRRSLSVGTISRRAKWASGSTSVTSLTALRNGSVIHCCLPCNSLTRETTRLPGLISSARPPPMSTAFSRRSPTTRGTLYAGVASGRLERWRIRNSGECGHYQALMGRRGGSRRTPPSGRGAHRPFVGPTVKTIE